MWKRLWWFIIAILWLIGCRLTAPTPTTPTTPDIIPITNDAEEILATQPGPLWVMVSGVDEHGLIAEHELILLSRPDKAAVSPRTIHTGTAVAVYEIRHTGSQALQRFYRIQATSGEAGWISDFYIRRVVYVFNPEGTTVPLFSGPGENELAQLANITPVAVKSPVADWWIVQTMDSDLTGWVQAGYIKESPEPEFLLNQQHAHP